MRAASVKPGVLLLHACPSDRKRGGVASGVRRAEPLEHPAPGVFLGVIEPTFRVMAVADTSASTSPQETLSSALDGPGAPLATTPDPT